LTAALTPEQHWLRWQLNRLGPNGDSLTLTRAECEHLLSELAALAHERDDLADAWAKARREHLDARAERDRLAAQAEAIIAYLDEQDYYGKWPMPERLRELLAAAPSGEPSK
jgi:chorismate mutase